MKYVRELCMLLMDSSKINLQACIHADHLYSQTKNSSLEFQEGFTQCTTCYTAYMCIHKRLTLQCNIALHMINGLVAVVKANTYIFGTFNGLLQCWHIVRQVHQGAPKMVSKGAKMHAAKVQRNEGVQINVCSRCSSSSQYCSSILIQAGFFQEEKALEPFEVPFPASKAKLSPHTQLCVDAEA